MISPERISKGMYWQKVWSLIEGCTPVSPGCDHCWSASQADMRQHNPAVAYRYEGLTQEGRFNGAIRLMTQDLNKPLQVKKPTVWAVWNDLFHEDVPFDFIVSAMDRMHQANQHTFLAITKRPERMHGFCRKYGLIPDAQGNTDSGEQWPENVWAITTAENQEQADMRVLFLLHVPVAVRGVSVEPMLGPVDLCNINFRKLNRADYALTDSLRGLHHKCGPGWRITKSWPGKIDWVIAGGESGTGARPMHPGWARSLRDQCSHAGIPFFMKQMAGHSKKNRKAIPEDLMIREFPPNAKR